MLIVVISACRLEAYIKPLPHGEVMRWALLTSLATLLTVGCVHHSTEMVVPSGADTAANPRITITDVESVLAKTTISQGPDSLGQTRSVWGPELYKKTATTSLLVLILNKEPNGSVKVVASGSGAVVTRDGQAVTNWHVAGSNKFVLALLYPGKGQSYRSLKDDGVWVARVIKTEQSKDLALLKLEQPLNGRASNMQAWNFLSLEDPNLIEVGQDVFAIGHPEGLHWTYTEGVISQIRPRYSWQSEEDKFQATVIQTQTAVSYGSSGGPLINRNGKLVGIISAGLPERPGFNFAISAHELRTFLALPPLGNTPADALPPPVKPPSFGGSGG